MFKCPCCSKLDYDACCGVYLSEKQIPQTPVALMRSRYTAYTSANIDYIKRTMQGKALEKFNEQEAKTWANRVKWIKLNIINIHNTLHGEGYVEFIAKFIENGQHRAIHEISEFRLIDGRWFYIDGVEPDDY